MRLQLANPARANAWLTFDEVACNQFQEMVESNFQLYKRMADDETFRKHLFDRLCERLRERVQDKGEAS